MTEDDFRAKIFPMIVAEDSLVICYSEIHSASIAEAGGDVLLMLGDHTVERHYANLN